MSCCLVWQEPAQNRQITVLRFLQGIFSYNHNSDLVTLMTGLFEIDLTNKMLQSPVFADKKQTPCIVVADIRQNTLEKNLRVQDIHDRIIEVLFYSGQVRVVDNSAENYDYMLQPELNP